MNAGDVSRLPVTPRQCHHRLVDIDCSHVRYPLPEPPGEHAFTGSHFKGCLRSGRDGIQEQRLVVDVVVPADGEHGQMLPGRRRPRRSRGDEQSGGPTGGGREWVRARGCYRRCRRLRTEGATRMRARPVSLVNARSGAPSLLAVPRRAGGAVPPAGTSPLCIVESPDLERPSHLPPEDLSVSVLYVPQHLDASASLQEIVGAGGVLVHTSLSTTTSHAHPSPGTQTSRRASRSPSVNTQRLSDDPRCSAPPSSGRRRSERETSRSSSPQVIHRRKRSSSLDSPPLVSRRPSDGAAGGRDQATPREVAPEPAISVRGSVVLVIRRPASIGATRRREERPRRTRRRRR